MSKIVEYQIVTGYDPLTQKHSTDTLSRVVAHQMREGWQPFGGVAVTTTPLGASGGGENVIIQAMVKYE